MIDDIFDKRVFWKCFRVTLVSNQTLLPKQEQIAGGGYVSWATTPHQSAIIPQLTGLGSIQSNFQLSYLSRHCLWHADVRSKFETDTCLVTNKTAIILERCNRKYRKRVLDRNYFRYRWFLIIVLPSPNVIFMSEQFFFNFKTIKNIFLFVQNIFQRI